MAIIFTKHSKNGLLEIQTGHFIPVLMTQSTDNLQIDLQMCSLFQVRKSILLKTFLWKGKNVIGKI